MKTEVLKPDQIARIHEATLHVLEEVGVEVPHRETLERFADLGASVDFASHRLKIPADMVTKCLETAGKTFSVYGRDLHHKAEFGVGQRHYNSIAGEALWIDSRGGSRRYPNIQDVVTAAKVADVLPSIGVVGAMADPAELPVSWRCIEVALTLLTNTTKPVTFWYHDRASARYLNELLVALRGSVENATLYPAYYPFLEPISPLRFAYNGIDLLYETSRLNLPVPIGPMAQMGISAPCTLAATMVQENAEILAGLCLTQVIREGTPVCYGGICHAFDMRTTQMIFSGPEQAIFGVAMTQMGKSYGLPVYINVGLTDAKIPDAQAGLETGVTLALGAAAGADIFGHMGISGVDQAASLEMLVLQDEVIAYVESTLRDVEFTDESLGITEIEEVGPGGTYIDRNFTADNFRREMWQPSIFDREYYDAWVEAGSRSTAQVCREKLDSILEHPTAEPLSGAVLRDIREVAAAAKQELGMKS